MNSENFGSPKAAALYAAAAGGDMARARKLIADGADPDSRNAREMSLLGVAMKEGNRTAFDNLLELGASPSHLGQARDTPMHMAAILEDSYWLKTMLQRGASTEGKNKLGETPLFAALGPNTEANVRLLLDAGANIHVRNNNDETLVHKAASINSYGDVLRFLELGVDPRATDRWGYTFQYAFFNTPENLLMASAKAQREKVRGWLRERGIAVEDHASR